ncbi:MAG TPA: STAS domain-containing protein [Mycobacteriales bacterium]|jgi:anti-anti-sigma regulatory factor|nr:STAS domain-containing protein [Mycobacteriales bacterium]
MNPPGDVSLDAVVLRVEVDLDIATEDRARRELQAAVAGSPGPGWLLMCFADDLFVDVRGVQLFVDAAADAVGLGRRLAVVAPPRSLRRIVSVLGIDELAIIDSWATVSELDDPDSATSV